jgi:hypothetical protein
LGYRYNRQTQENKTDKYIFHLYLDLIKHLQR